MNNLEAILEMWKKDSDIDEMNLDESSRATAKLHSKYLELYTVNKLKLKKLDLELKVILRDSSIITTVNYPKKKWILKDGITIH